MISYSGNTMAVTGFTTFFPMGRTSTIFDKFVKDREIYINEFEWALIKDKYTQERIIQELSDLIELYDIKLPYRVITKDDVAEDYMALKNLNWMEFYKHGKWDSKFKYEYHFKDSYIGLSNIGNLASDYFHQEQRWKCDATGYPSPEKTWQTEQYRLTLLKALFSLNVKEINPQVLRNIISLRKYIAAQFRPSAAKVIYGMFQAERVLDFSMGWGDRLLGAHASECVRRYVGFDPNTDLFKGYVQQLENYKHYLNPNESKSFTLIPNRAEDPSVYLNEEFDLVFTSPPYFDKEKYNQSSEQSYKRYKKFDSWMQNFLFTTIDLRTESLVSGGHLVINISDIYTRKKLYQICDGMNNYIASTGKFQYQGAVGLRMPKRPQSISSETAGIYGEPIWIWRKK